MIEFSDPTPEEVAALEMCNSLRICNYFLWDQFPEFMDRMYGNKEPQPLATVASQPKAKHGTRAFRRDDRSARRRDRKRGRRR